MRISFNGNSADFKAEGKKVIEDLKKLAQSKENMQLAPDNYEGVKFTTNFGTVIVRMSVHDPVMPINFESDDVGGTKLVACQLLEILSAYRFLELENLTNYTL